MARSLLVLLSWLFANQAVGATAPRDWACQVAGGVSVSGSYLYPQTLRDFWANTPSGLCGFDDIASVTHSGSTLYGLQEGSSYLRLITEFDISNGRYVHRGWHNWDRNLRLASFCNTPLPGECNQLASVGASSLWVVKFIVDELTPFTFFAHYVMNLTSYGCGPNYLRFAREKPNDPNTIEEVLVLRMPDDGLGTSTVLDGVLSPGRYQIAAEFNGCDGLSITAPGSVVETWLPDLINLWQYSIELGQPIDPELSSLSLSSPVVAGCKSVTGTVTLTGPAPAGGKTVTITDTLGSATTPLSVTVKEGATKQTFPVKTVPVSEAEEGAIGATLGSKTYQKNLKVRPMSLTSLTLTPTAVVGSQPVNGKATLECNAGPGPVAVDLASNSAGVAYPVAASIVVPQGVQSVNFDVTTNPVQAKSYATIAGTANGITKSKNLTVNVATSVSPTSLKFGSLLVGQTSAPLNATLTNKGAVPFTVNGMSLTGTGAPWFAQTNNCPASLAAGASCTISVTFTPQAAASKSAKLSIATSATSTPISVSLSGTGI